MPITTAPQIFDRTALQRSKQRRAKKFKDYDFLYNLAVERMLERLDDLVTPFESVLVLGGHNNHIIRSRFSDALYASNIDTKATLCVDEEFLPFAENSFDLVIAPPGLHWVNDLPGCLAQIRNILKPDGFFLSVLYGGETLFELRDALTQAELKTSDGVAPRVSPFVDKQQAGGLLQRAGFALPVVDSDLITVTYENTFKLYDDLRGMGENNFIFERKKTFTPRRLFMEAEQYYALNHADSDQRLRATFEIIFLAGWAPHSSQQKPLRPGSAEHSLADRLGVNEIKTDEKVGS